MTRNGKIARLPRQLRETINQRLENNEPVEPILAWLNPLPEVQAVLQDQFKGIPISKQNLYEWRKGGYHEWEFRRDFDYDAEESRADGRHLEDLTDDCLADSLGVIITARYNSLVRSWLGDEPTDEFKAKLKVMRVLVQDVSQMRRWDHSAHKVALANAKYEDQKYYAHQAEMEKLQKKVDQQKDFIAFLQELAAARKAREAADLVAASRQSAADSPTSAPGSTSSTQSTPSTLSVHRSGDSLSPHPEPPTAPSPNHPPHSSHSHPPTTPAEESPAAPATVAPISSFFILPSSFQSGPVKPSKTTFTTPPPAPIPAEPTSSQPVTENKPTNLTTIPAAGDSPSPHPEAHPETSPTSPHNSPALHASHPPHFPPPTDAPTTLSEIPPAPTPAEALVSSFCILPSAIPASPCIGVCQNDGGGHCLGCLRSIPEVLRWPVMPPEQKRQCLEHLALRRRKKESRE